MYHEALKWTFVSGALFLIGPSATCDASLSRIYSVRAAYSKASLGIEVGERTR